MNTSLSVYGWVLGMIVLYRGCVQECVSHLSSSHFLLLWCTQLHIAEAEQLHCLKAASLCSERFLPQALSCKKQHACGKARSFLLHTSDREGEIQSFFLHFFIPSFLPFCFLPLFFPVFMTWVRLGGLVRRHFLTKDDNIAVATFCTHTVNTG